MKVTKSGMVFFVEREMSMIRNVFVEIWDMFEKELSQIHNVLVEIWDMFERDVND